METLLTDDILDYLTEIGDPLVDPKVKARSKRKASKEQLLRDLNEARNKGLSSLKGDWLTKNATSFGVDRLLENPGTLPDPDLVKTACDLFARYGSEIAAALLLAALPEAYAAGEGAKVLIDRSQLAKGGTVSTRRILATAQFVIWVLTPDTSGGPVSGDMKEYTYQSFDDTLRLWGPGKDRGQALRASLALRIMHSLIRTSRPDAPRGLQLADDDGVPLYQIDDPDDVPLNQTDLLATLLSFSITVFEVLEKFGIYWTAEEQEAFFYVWDHVGNTLGIGDTDVVLKLTGTESLEDLKKTLRAFDEGDDPPAGGCSLSPTDTEKLFKGRLNRRVLRRVADVGNLRPQSVPEARALLARLRERMA